jgi:hypothetical protein
LEPSVSSGDDIVWFGFPCERLGAVGIVFADEAIDGSLEVDDGMEDPVFETTARQLCEEAFNGIEP